MVTIHNTIRRTIKMWTWYMNRDNFAYSNVNLAA